jgi:hypothetical protein
MPGGRVWLPLSFQGTAAQAGATPLTERQLEELIDSLQVPPERLVSPEPLGIRQVFAWRLEAALQKQEGAALEDFALLVEGLWYGLLETATFDLADTGLPLHQPEDRYLTVLQFRSGSSAPPTTAGTFAPDTLVCPAGNWAQREWLESAVRSFRGRPEASQARAYGKAFAEQFAYPAMLWHRGLRWLLAKHSPQLTDPGEEHQRNLGPLQLRWQEGNQPGLAFFPSFQANYLSRLVQALQADTLHPDGAHVVAMHQNHRVAAVRYPVQASEPRYFGAGNVDFLESAPGVMPAAAAFTPATRDRLLREFHAVRTLFPTPGRFVAPDVIRGLHHSMGPAAASHWTGQAQRWVYSPAAHRAAFRQPPHLRFDRPGLHADGDTMVFASHPFPRVEELSTTNALAFHIERYEGQDLGELTGLGHALWRLFLGDRVEDCLADYDGWIGPSARLTVQPPDPAKAIDWGTFLHLAQQERAALFGAAALQYGQRTSAGGVPRLFAQPQTLQVGPHRWYRKA